MIQEETDYLNSPTANFLKPFKGNPTPLFKGQVLQTTPSERKHGGKHLCAQHALVWEGSGSAPSSLRTEAAGILKPLRSGFLHCAGT